MLVASKQIRAKVDYDKLPKKEQVFVDCIPSEKTKAVGKRQAYKLCEVLTKYPNPSYQSQS